MLPSNIENVRMDHRRKEHMKELLFSKNVEFTEFHLRKLGTLKLNNTCGFHFSPCMSSGNKNPDVLEEPLSSFTLKNVVLMGNLY